MRTELDDSNPWRIEKPQAPTNFRNTDLGYFAGLFVQANLQRSGKTEIDHAIYQAKALIEELNKETK
jgi:hypothetical protein